MSPRAKAPATTPKIHADMRVAEILALLPESEKLLAGYGLSCFSCAANEYETLAMGCQSHGFGEDELKDLVADLNELLTSRPERPQTLTVTQSAAVALGEVMVAEEKNDHVLIVDVDVGGGFCLNFASEPSSDMKEFTHPEAPSVRIFASTMTLGRIGGATIDHREGRFKLDLPDAVEKAGCACKNGGTCDCGKGGGGCGCH